MKATLKKKLTAAILAGCSTFILSGVALANPPQLPPPPSRPFVHNEEVQNYCTQFESDYSWMYLSTLDILPMPKGRGFLDTNDTCLLK